MKKITEKLLSTEERNQILTFRRNEKMARSAHAFVRGSTKKFYEWLEASEIGKFPEGPPIWICGDCHLGNLGPIANAEGKIDIQIRDVDQTVIGNPAHDLIRLGLSLATAARGSDLPGVTTVKMLEQLIEGYEEQFEAAPQSMAPDERPESVRIVLKDATRRSWKHLAEERIDDTTPTIPLGKRFWPLSKPERAAIEAMFEKKTLSRLATLLRSRDDDAPVSVLDAAYWMKGCSSLGQLRFAVLLDVGGGQAEGKDLCLIDIKEAVKAAAPRVEGMQMPRDHGERVLEGARHLSPHLGERMRASQLLDHSVFIRELLPQDLKLEIEQLTRDEAMKAARYVATVVGKAHSRQMDEETRLRWKKELKLNRSKKIDAPSWLWDSVVELVANHEAAYLEHCRDFADKQA